MYWFRRLISETNCHKIKITIAIPSKKWEELKIMNHNVKLPDRPFSQSAIQPVSYPPPMTWIVYLKSFSFLFDIITFYDFFLERKKSISVDDNDINVNSSPYMKIKTSFSNLGVFFLSLFLVFVGVAGAGKMFDFQKDKITLAWLNSNRTLKSLKQNKKRDL